jgi:hypothetical protein
MPVEGDVVEVDDQGRTVPSATTAPAIAAASAKPADPHALLIERVREAAFLFNEGLPNFVCDQFVTRYESKTLKPAWKYLDRLQVELLYMGGREEYRNIRRNGKPVKKSEDAQKTGSWSTGEFGSILINILHPNAAATFKFRRDSTASGMNVKVYSFRIEQPRSNWLIQYGASYKPAHNGSLWIEPESARVIRIEMDSKELPSTYDIDKVETIVDYAWVQVGAKKFILPTRSETLACWRDSFNCDRNEIEFKNYRKFDVESQVLTSDSDISFPEAEPENAPASKGKTTPPSLTPDAASPAPATKPAPKPPAKKK